MQYTGGIRTTFDSAHEMARLALRLLQPAAAACDDPLCSVQPSLLHVAARLKPRAIKPLAARQRLYYSPIEIMVEIALFTSR